MSQNTGFSMIELLVVMAIIAILASIAIFGLGQVFSRSRDAQRKSDLKQYSAALENWADANQGFYPSRTAQQGASSVLCGDLNMSECPDDPISTSTYYYNSDGTGYGNNDGASYLLWAVLENGDYATTHYVVCSDGRSGECNACGGDADGACPL